MPHPSHKRAYLYLRTGTSVHPEKNNVSCKSGRSNLILDVAKHHRIATHYSRLSSLDAAVPMQKVPQHPHPSTAQCQQQHTKSHLETTSRPQLQRTGSPSRIPRQSGDARTRRTSKPNFLRAGLSVYLRRHFICSSSNAICFISILYSPVRFSAPPYSSLN